MILIKIAIGIAIVGIICTIIGLIAKSKIIRNIGISFIIAVVIGIIMFFIYTFYEMDRQEKSQHIHGSSINIYYS